MMRLGPLKVMPSSSLMLKYGVISIGAEVLLSGQPSKVHLLQGLPGGVSCSLLFDLVQLYF